MRHTYFVRDAVLTERGSLGWEANITTMPYGARFRMHRRAMQDYFSPARITDYQTLHRQEACSFLLKLLNTPHDIRYLTRRYVPFAASMQHIVSSCNRFITGVVMKLTYGHTVKSADDPYARLSEQALTATVRAGNFASMLVDFFPICKSIVFGGIKQWCSDATRASQ